MIRGDIVVVVMPGEFGKPRPAVVVQSHFFQDLDTVSILPIMSTFVDAPLLRIPVDPTAANGLQKPSYVMVDTIMTVRKERIRQTIGRMEDTSMVEIQRSLMVFLGLA